MSDPSLAEDSIVGAILLTGGKILDEVPVVAADFASPRAGRVIELSEELRKRGQAVDPVTIMDAAAADPATARIIDIGWLHDCLTRTPSAASAEFYAEIVAKEATRRRLRETAVAIAEEATQAEDVDAAVEKARGMIERAARIDPSAVQRFGDTFDETLTALEGAQTAYPTPWEDLTRAIIGFEPGRVYMVGARPGVGKTVFGLQVALWLARGGNVAYVSMEMKAHELHLRTLAHDQKIDITRLLRHHLQQQDWQKLADSHERLSNLPLFIDDRPNITVPMIRQFARNVARQGKLYAVVVDYIQLISAPRGMESRSRYEIVSDTSRALKLLANELEVPVIALAQLNRATEQRGQEQPPRVSDLRDSGSLEQDADVVILMHRDQTPEKAGEMKMLVGKNRHGPTAILEFDFYGHYSEIRQRGGTALPHGNYGMDRQS
jgi:replicative DNA helicase